MGTPIPKDRLAVLLRAPLCRPAREWLAVEGRTYEDLAERPEWALIAARVPGANTTELGKIVAAYGTPELRRRFVAEISGADTELLLRGL